MDEARIKQIVKTAMTNAIKVDKDDENGIDALDEKWTALMSEHTGFLDKLDKLINDYYGLSLEKKDSVYRSDLRDAIQLVDKAGDALKKVAEYATTLNNLWNDRA